MFSYIFVTCTDVISIQYLSLYVLIQRLMPWYFAQYGRCTTTHLSLSTNTSQGLFRRSWGIWGLCANCYWSTTISVVSAYCDCISPGNKLSTSGLIGFTQDMIRRSHFFYGIQRSPCGGWCRTRVAGRRCEHAWAEYFLVFDESAVVDTVECSLVATVTAATYLIAFT